MIQGISEVTGAVIKPRPIVVAVVLAVGVGNRANIWDAVDAIQGGRLEPRQA